MDKFKARRLFVREKAFLLQLCDGGDFPDTITQYQAQSLLYLLHFLTNGDIPVTEATFQKLKSSCNILHLRSKIESKKALYNILKSPLSTQLQIIDKFKAIWGLLVKPIFDS
jgi:hypothetical protein